MLPIDIFHTTAVGETEIAGAKLAERLLRDTSLPRFVALYGDLGVGKTAFVRGFIQKLCPGAVVRSPTFALVHEYCSSRMPIYHFDMYRIDSEDDLDSIGFYEYPERGGICLVEWSEKIPYALPEAFLRATIEKDKLDFSDSRKITIELVRRDI